jgi:hypothetical protein
MATEKKITSRIQQKHDVAANWAKATNFIPKKGEIIIYDAEYNASGEETQPVRFKIGDGSKTVNNLPFAVIDGEQKISGIFNFYTGANDSKSMLTGGKMFFASTEDDPALLLVGKEDVDNVPTAFGVVSYSNSSFTSTVSVGDGQATEVLLGGETGSTKQVFTSQGSGATPKWTSVVNSLNGNTGDITGIATTSQLDNKQDKITSSNKLSSSFIDGLGAAAAKAVDTAISANSTSTNLPTSKAVEDRINAHSGIDKVGTITGIKMNDASKGTSGVVDLGTVLTDASKFATSAQGTKADNAMPKSGGTFTGEVKFGSTENFQGYYIKRMIGSLGAGTAYNNLDSSYKDGTWHRMWRLRFPSGSNFWGKIKITLYGGYSSFNASGVMSKSITCNFNTSSIYNNVGCYDGLGVNVEQDFRISEAIWNSTASAWEVLIWQKNLSGNNSPVIMLECWTTNNTSYINAFNGITAQPVELTQSTSYSAQKASPTGDTKTVTWATLPVYENPLGEEIATMSDFANVVKTTGDQHILGEKTFSNVILNNARFGDSNRVYGASDSEVVDQFLPAKSGTFAMLDDIPDVSGKANLDGGNTFTGKQTFNNTVGDVTNQLVLNETQWDIFTCRDLASPTTKTAVGKGSVWCQDSDSIYSQFKATGIYYGNDTSGYDGTLKFPTNISGEKTIATTDQIPTFSLSGTTLTITLP